MKTVHNTLILIGLCALLTACSEVKTSSQRAASEAITAEAATTENFMSSFQTLSQDEANKLGNAVLTAQKPKLLKFRDSFGYHLSKKDDCRQCEVVALNADEAVLLINLGGGVIWRPMAAYRVSRHPPYPAKPLLLPSIVEAVDQEEGFPHVGHNLSIDASNGIISQGIYDDQPIEGCEGCGDIDREWRFDGQNFQLTKAIGP